MGMRKGQKHYPKAIREQIREEWVQGKSVSELSREHGISRYSIQSWCGLRSEVNIRQSAPRRKGRPRQRPISMEHELTIENKRLKMENEMLRDFLRVVGRR